MILVLNSYRIHQNLQSLQKMHYQEDHSWCFRHLSNHPFNHHQVIQTSLQFIHHLVIHLHMSYQIILLQVIHHLVSHYIILLQVIHHLVIHHLVIHHLVIHHLVIHHLVIHHLVIHLQVNHHLVILRQLSLLIVILVYNQSFLFNLVKDHHPNQPHLSFHEEYRFQQKLK